MNNTTRHAKKPGRDYTWSLRAAFPSKVLLSRNRSSILFARTLEKFSYVDIRNSQMCLPSKAFCWKRAHNMKHTRKPPMRMAVPIKYSSK